jgi:hypothetical protein
MIENNACHKFFQRATRGALSVYLSLLAPQKPSAGDESKAEEDGADAEDARPMTAAERQKAKLKQRKQKSKEKAAQAAVAEISSAAAAESAKKTAAAGSGDKPKEDDDPLGAKILALDHMTEALRWCSAISRHPKSDPDTHELVCAVYLMKGKISLALRAINSGLKSDPTHAGLIFQLVKCARHLENVDGAAAPLNPLVEPVVRSELSRLLGDAPNSVEYARRYMASSLSTHSLQHRVVAARLALLIEGSTGSSAAAAFLAVPVSLRGRGVSAKTVIPAFKV